MVNFNTMVDFLLYKISKKIEAMSKCDNSIWWLSTKNKKEMFAQKSKIHLFFNLIFNLPT